MSGATARGIRVNFRDSALDSIDCDEFVVHAGEIVDLVWPELLDAPQTRSFDRWVRADLGLEPVGPVVVSGMSENSESPLETVSLQLVGEDSFDAQHFVSSIGLDYTETLAEAAYSEQLLLVAASFLRRDGVVVLTTAGCAPTGIERVITGLRAIVGTGCVLHVSYPIHDRGSRDRHLFDHQLIARRVPSRAEGVIGKLLRMSRWPVCRRS